MTMKRSGKVLEHAVGWAKLEGNLHNHFSGEPSPLLNPVKLNPKHTAFSTLCTQTLSVLAMRWSRKDRERGGGTRTQLPSWPLFVCFTQLKLCGSWKWKRNGVELDSPVFSSHRTINSEDNCEYFHLQRKEKDQTGRPVPTILDLYTDVSLLP
jgi:hypothetical protein